MTEKLTSLSIDDMERIIDVLRNQHEKELEELEDKLLKMIHDSIEEPWRFHYNDWNKRIGKYYWSINILCR